MVASIVGDTDTSALYTQVQADLAAFRAQEQAGFAQWSAAQQAAFDAWYAQIQSVLGEDAAGNLLNLITYHAPLQRTVSLPASGWSAAAPYTQTVTAVDVLATDTPLADVVLSNVAATAIAQLEAYGCVGRIDAGEGQITVTCYEDKPAADLTLALKVVR